MFHRLLQVLGMCDCMNCQDDRRLRAALTVMSKLPKRSGLAVTDRHGKVTMLLLPRSAAPSEAARTDAATGSASQEKSRR